MWRNLSTLMAAVICGFISGSLSTRLSVNAAATPAVVRGSKFELVDDSGRQIAIWQGDQSGRSALSFLGSDQKEVITLGLQPDKSPILNMMGKEGKIRLTIRLGTGDKPVLGMGDEKWEGRVILGYIEPDVRSERDDDWGLLFRAPGLGSALASIGVTSGPSLATSGHLAVRSSSGKQWSVPE
jgi:hypothetical protein